jgi:uncharacterized protein (TIGR02996 family)
MSPDEASRLHAVLADPDADEPRLAYADYLATSSRSPDQARAICPIRTRDGRP